MNILITGASRGIGEAIANKFKENKHNTVFTPSSNEVDLSLDGHVSGFMANRFTNEQPIDILINCAGINNPLPFKDIRPADIYESLQVNFRSHMSLCQWYLPFMVKKQYGRILNIGSIWINVTKENRAAYNISKSALHSMTKSIAVEYGKYNILCNTLSPGFVLTDMTKNNNTNEELALIQNEIPIKRLASVDEIAKLAHFLTVENTYINGQNIIIDGGYSVCA